MSAYENDRKTAMTHAGILAVLAVQALTQANGFAGSIVPDELWAIAGLYCSIVAVAIILVVMVLQKPQDSEGVTA